MESPLIAGINCLLNSQKFGNLCLGQVIVLPQIPQPPKIHLSHPPVLKDTIDISIKPVYDSLVELISSTAGGNRAWFTFFVASGVLGIIFLFGLLGGGHALNQLVSILYGPLKILGIIMIVSSAISHIFAFKNDSKSNTPSKAVGISLSAIGNTLCLLKQLAYGVYLFVFVITIL